ncbi:MAG TPA: hypothetical protein VN911_01040 [Candidatus Acidoferrum sp.]|nr:hypothetical protein [Candidatus Acidoferrum sp.]
MPIGVDESRGRVSRIDHAIRQRGIGMVGDVIEAATATPFSSATLITTFCPAGDPSNN